MPGQRFTEDQIRETHRGRTVTADMRHDREGGDSWSRAIIPRMNGEKAKDGGFERRLTGAWRSVRRHLPPRVAEAIRVRAKRLLRGLRVIS